MATDFNYPTSAELMQIARDKMPVLIQDDPLFNNVMPIVEEDAPILVWEQADNYTGLQQVRGVNGEPAKVQKTGAKRYMEQPGIYGEFIPIDENELLFRRQYATWAQPVDITDLVMDAQDQLLNRRLDRLRVIGWGLLATGTFSVPGPNGAILHTGAYTTQVYTAATAWATYASATPLADLRAVKLLARGHSINLGARAKAYMSQVTANRLFSNTNSVDLYGRRTAGLGTFNSEAQINQLMAGDDLPQIVIYDEGYLPDGGGGFIPFLADGVVIVVGLRPAGQKVAEYRMVRNVSNPGMTPGAYQEVIDHAKDGPPRAIEVHDGHNGGPVLFFPSAIVRMNV